MLGLLALACSSRGQAQAWADLCKTACDPSGIQVVRWHGDFDKACICHNETCVVSLKEP